MQSIENKILVSLMKCGRGTSFTPSRFAHYRTSERSKKPSNG